MQPKSLPHESALEGLKSGKVLPFADLLDNSILLLDDATEPHAQIRCDQMHESDAADRFESMDHKLKVSRFYARRGQSKKLTLLF